MTLHTTENIRAGFFLGKSPHITNIPAFTTWVKDRLGNFSNSCPEFQLNVEGIGRYKDISTKSRAIVVICSQSNISALRLLLDRAFHSQSNYPFTPFPVMYSLDIPTQTALYKAQKSRILGPEMMEFEIPTFSDLDTKVLINSNPLSLRDACFDLRNPNGTNLFIDVDNATRSESSVFQLNKADKQEAQKYIDSWIKTHFKIQIHGNTDQQFDAKTFRLDTKS
jgi:hypothetical protein